MIPVSTFSDYASSMDFGSPRENMGLNLTIGGVTIKQHDLTNMSRPQIDTKTKFDDLVLKFKSLKTGSRIKGVKVNTGFNGKNKPQVVIGRLKNIVINRAKQEIRVFIYDPINNKEIEIYSETVAPVNESFVKTMDEFLVID